MLRHLYRAARDPRVRTRLHLLWRVRAGETVVAAAAQVGVPVRTAHHWLARYRAAGRGALCDTPRPRGGARSRLTDAQWDAVRAHLRAGTTRTAAQLAAWIAATFQVQYHLAWLRVALRRRRLRLKVPRPISDKADRAAQAAWKKGGSPPG
jgi:transposase